jgi:hypothetical protein
MSKPARRLHIGQLIVAQLNAARRCERPRLKNALVLLLPLTAGGELRTAACVPLGGRRNHHGAASC